MYCNKCGNEIKDGETFCGKCGNNINEIVNSDTQDKPKFWTIKKNLIVLGILIIAILLMVYIPRVGRELSKVKVPNFVGLTISQAKDKAKNSNLELSVYNASTDNEKVISQHIAVGERVNKNTHINVYTKEYKEKAQIEQAERQKVSDLIQQWVGYVINVNQGSFRYGSYSDYGTAKNGQKIYKITYDIGYHSSDEKRCYYQLVSLDTNSSKITNSTKLYYFAFYKGKEIVEDNDKMKWEAKQIWGI